ncbi:MAG: alpha/beta-type small acid-soluble spore protein [Tissierellaceae bacterium]|nr:alpha/beta-type small acid-soluble spore protein [Tissierellaceae bacterium]
MANNNSGSKRVLVPEARHALNQMKLEIANELGMSNYDSMDKGTLTSRENGYVGGNITRNLVRMAQENLGKTGGTGQVEDIVTPNNSGGTNSFR